MRTFMTVLLSLVAVAPAHAVTFTDTWTEARTKVALLADPRVVGDDVSRISVTADAGTVRLDGSVISEEAKLAAGAAASAVTGVSIVDNALRVVPGPVATVQTTDREIEKMVTRDLGIFRRPGLGGRTVSVHVRDGIATLTGSVADITEWVVASERARQTLGVRAVDNRLWVKELRLSTR